MDREFNQRVAQPFLFITAFFKIPIRKKGNTGLYKMWTLRCTFFIISFLPVLFRKTHIIIPFENVNHKYI